MNIPRIFDPTTGASNTILKKKLPENEVNEITRDPKDWITDLELLRQNFWKLVVIIDDVEMMTNKL